MHFLAKGFSNINRLLFCFSRLVASLLIFASTYIARESYTVHTFVSPCTYRHMFVEFVFIDSGSDPIIDKALCVLSIMCYFLLSAVVPYLSSALYCRITSRVSTPPGLSRKSRSSSSRTSCFRSTEIQNIRQAFWCAYDTLLVVRSFRYRKFSLSFHCVSLYRSPLPSKQS